MSKISLTALLAAVMLSAPHMVLGQVVDDEPPADTSLENAPSDLELMLNEFADTPEEHRAAARYFKLKAEEHRRLADKHGAIAQNYSSGKMRDAQLTREESKRIAETEAIISADYAEMARAHETEARR